MYKDAADELYFLEKGRIAVEIGLGIDRKAIVYTARPGEAFAWSALVPPHILTASLVGVEPSTVLCVSRKGLLEEFDRDPQVARVVLEHTARLIATRLKDTRLQFVNLLQWQMEHLKSD